MSALCDRVAEGIESPSAGAFSVEQERGRSALRVAKTMQETVDNVAAIAAWRAQRRMLSHRHGQGIRYLEAGELEAVARCAEGCFDSQGRPRNLVIIRLRRPDRARRSSETSQCVPHGTR